MLNSKFEWGSCLYWEYIGGMIDYKQTLGSRVLESDFEPTPLVSS